MSSGLNDRVKQHCRLQQLALLLGLAQEAQERRKGPSLIDDGWTVEHVEDVPGCWFLFLFQHFINSSLGQSASQPAASGAYSSPTPTTNLPLTLPLPTSF